MSGNWKRYAVVLSLIVVLLAGAAGDARAKIPYLQKKGTATQLIVEGRPYVMLGGELHNSSSSSLEYMEAIWDKLVKLNVNTVLAPISWELVEPEEGTYEFRLIDGLVEKAREHDLKLVFLWFGSWKNGESSYCPGWIKINLTRFARAQNESGKNLNVLSVFSEEACAADAAAFAQVMRRIRKIDKKENTVIMVQVENEVGLLSTSRDRSAAAESVFNSVVPSELMSYLAKHKENLLPELKKTWGRTGFRENGSWQEVFGEGIETDEIFMAWHYARYINKVVAAGKKEYPLPMYVNAWIVQFEGEKPGQYPSGGPIAKILDIWRAGGPQIDIFATDIYLPDFKRICASYARSSNPLLIPEATGDVWFKREGWRLNESARNVFWAIAEHDAICFAPFGVEGTDVNQPIVQSYEVLSKLMPLITEYQGTEKMIGVLQEKSSDEEKGIDAEVGEYLAHLNYMNQEKDDRAYGLIINTGPDEYLVAGYGFSVKFEPLTGGPRYAGILEVWEGRYENGKWVPGRLLNGDESGQGSVAKVPPNDWDRYDRSKRPRVVRLKLYRHD
jgi:beta-galactosidase GanA